MKSVNYGQVVMMDTCVCYQKSLVNTEPIASLTAKGCEYYRQIILEGIVFMLHKVNLCMSNEKNLQCEL